MAFSDLQSDPIRSSEILDLLGVPYYDLDNPKKFVKIKEVVDYFSNWKDPRYQILKLTQLNRGENKLDTIWTWMQLQKEREAQLAQFNPTEFEKDIETQLMNGFLTNDNAQKVREDVNQRLEQKRQEAEMARVNVFKQKLEDAKYEESKSQMLNRVADVVKLHQVKESINQLDLVTKALQYYEPKNV